jgi:hypothetical protein
MVVHTSALHEDNSKENGNMNNNIAVLRSSTAGMSSASSKRASPANNSRQMQFSQHEKEDPC